MKLIELYRGDHTASCLQGDVCSCARFQFLITGVLAIVSASVAGAIGYGSSMALLSEAPHGLMDGLADFLGFFLLIRHGHEMKASEGKWHYVQALFLFVAATWIGYELFERLTTNAYPINGLYALLGSGVGLAINYLRLGFVRTAGTLSKIRNGIIKHIEADILHMKVAVALALALLVLQAVSLVSWLVPFDALCTTFLVIRMYWITYQIARGFGCGHDHQHGDGGHEHHHGDCHH